MKDDRSIAQHLLIVLFVAHTISNLITYYLSEVSLLVIFSGTVLIVSVVYILGNSTFAHIMVNFTIALQMTNVLSYLLSISIVLEPSIWLVIIVASITAILSFLPLLKINQAMLSTITNSFLAVGAASSLLMVMNNHALFDYLALTYPFIASFIYVILSNKVENGFSILFINTIATVLIAYLLVLSTNSIGVLLSISETDVVLCITWLTTFIISIVFNSNPHAELNLYYQRFQNDKEEILQDIRRLKWNITNADQLSDEKLFQAIHLLRSIKLENNLKRMLTGTITKYNLSKKYKEIKSTTWFLVFCAYLIFATLTLNLYNSSDNNLLFLIAGLVYCFTVPYIISMILYKKMIKYVNKKFIHPFNELNEERNTLIEKLKNILLDRGYIKLNMTEFENVYSTNKERLETTLDI